MSLPERDPRDHEPARQADVPGASCQRRYEQLRSKDLQERRERRARSIVLLVVLTLGAGLVVGGLVMGLAALVDGWLASRPGAAQRTASMMPVWMVAALVGVAMFATAMNLSRAFWGPKQTTESYRIGAEGERRAGRELAVLEAQGWTVLHDRKAGSRDENIDHLAVGPSGVVVIETKNWRGKVRVDVNALRRDGHDESGVLAQVERQIRAVRGAVAVMGDAVEVRAVIYFPRADVSRGGSRTSPARPRGIRCCEPRNLIATIFDGPTVLSSEQVEAVAAILRDRLVPA